MLTVVICTISAVDCTKKHSCKNVISDIVLTDGNDKDATVVMELKRLLDGGAGFAPDCPLELVKVGLFQAAEMIIRDYFLKNGENIENYFKFGAKSIMTKLDGLHKQSMLSGRSVEIRPAFKWGQSQERILMFVKFANRIDSPGCLDRSDLKVNVGENNELSLDAHCVLAGALVYFKLDFPLFADVWPQSVKIENAGVGSILVSFKKRKLSIWPQIWKTGHPKIPTASVWWDLKGKEYDSSMKTFSKLHQKIDAEDEEGLWASNKKAEPSFLVRAWQWIISLFSGRSN